MALAKLAFELWFNKWTSSNLFIYLFLYLILFIYLSSLALHAILLQLLIVALTNKNCEAKRSRGFHRCRILS